MNAEKLLLLMEKKKNAIAFFKDAFKENLELKDNIRLNDIEFEYIVETDNLKNDIKPFSKYTTEFNRLLLDSAYEYMKSAINNKRTITLKNKELVKLLEAYNNLTISVSKYSFISTDYAQSNKQDNTNNEIVLLISMLKPVLIDLLTDADKTITYFKEKNWPNKHILTFINKETKKLADSQNNLDTADCDYHIALDKVYRHKKDQKKELNERKKAWQNAKNNSCRDILALYASLIKLLNSIADNVSYDKELYHSILGQMLGSSYYYFLSPEENEIYTTNSIIRKKKKK